MLTLDVHRRVDGALGLAQRERIDLRDLPGERFRLAVVRVPHQDGGYPVVSYFIRPFDTYELHFAQAYVPLNVADLVPYAVEPQ